MALLPCIKNPIRLEVYLDEDDSAGGNLYLDDGETYEYMNSTDGHADIHFGYWGNQLTSTNNAGNNYETGRD